VAAVQEVSALNEQLAAAKKLAEAGGDWDRRNRLKVYEATALLLTRDFARAAPLLVEGVATFACAELCTYDEFVFRAVAVCVAALPRTELAKRIVGNPQVVAALRSQPALQGFLLALHRCNYREFFAGLTHMYAALARDRYLAGHIRYVTREFRILAYAQYLEAYRSVRTQSMAEAFGLDLALLDRELAHFIAVGRLSAKIDKVGGIVVSSRADAKNAQYQETLKRGDALLNQVQKLVRVIDA
jgi:26S proteasome regulatory subunit N7